MTTHLPESSTIRRLLLFFLVAGMAAFGRDFAYLGYSEQVGLPVYITEIILFVSLGLSFFAYCTMAELRTSFKTAINVPLAMYWLWGLCLLVPGLSTYGLDALRDFTVLYYSLFIFLAVGALQTLNDVKLLLYVIIAANLISSLQSMRQIVEGDIVAYGMYLRFMAGDVGLYSLIGFLAVVVSHLSCPRQDRRSYLLLFLLPILFIGMMATQARSILLAFAGASIVLFVLLPHREKKGLIIMVLLVSSLVGVALTVIPNAWSVFWEQMPKYLTFFDLQEGSNAIRLVNYQYAVERIAASPFWGVGLGAPEIFDYGGYEVLPVRSPHNSFLGVAFRMGVIGLILFLLFLVRFYSYMVSRIVQVKDRELRGYAAVILAAQIAVVVVALFNVTLESPQNGIIFWILIGAALRVVQLDESKTEDQIPVRQRALSHIKSVPASLARRSGSGR